MGTIAVVTARGGSKGVPRKNIRLLGGRPLIAWTVEAAVLARTVDRVVVSSDSEEILQAAREAGGETPFLRPAELSGDLAKQEDAVLHAMEWVQRTGATFANIVLLAPTNPMRDAAEIDAVVSAFIANPLARATVTVVPCKHSPLHANTLPDDGSMRDFIPAGLRLKNRQELPQHYRLDGAVCVAEWEHFRRVGSFVTDEAYAYIHSRQKGIDIDDEEDFALAEVLLGRLDHGPTGARLGRDIPGT
jgi:N-acylneuraminate cytidylyltransferase/CMP-N,N'-diacetyllegionaminic acid synthase